MSEYKWQGEPVKIKYGNCIVKKREDKPLWWFNFECALGHSDIACVPVIQITMGDDYQFMIANHFGIGIHKLINGGWPSHAHFSVEGDFDTKPKLMYSEFDHEGYSTYESDRRKWEKDNFPEEFKRFESLRRGILKNKI